MKAPSNLLALLAVLLAALLLAGCSSGGRVETDDEDGDGEGDAIEGGGEIEDEDENDAPGAALGVMLAVLGLAAVLRRRT